MSSIGGNPAFQPNPQSSDPALNVQARARELEPLRLLSDEPIGGDEPDDLGRDADARLLAELALGTPGPFTVGVYGPWGSGKTSLLKRVAHLLDERDTEAVGGEKAGVASWLRRLVCRRDVKDGANPYPRRYPFVVTVFFNAWQHAHEAQPLSHLTAAIHDAILIRLRELQTTPDLFQSKAFEFLRATHLATRALFGGMSVQLAPGLAIDVAKINERYEALQREQEKPDSEVWRTHVRDSATMASVRTLHATGNTLDAASTKEPKETPRIVVFIDDMDRCNPAEAFKLLQGLKLALAQPGFVFILSLNPSDLQKFIEQEMQWTDPPTRSRHNAIYLDKLVQLPYELRLRRHQFENFAKSITHDRVKDILNTNEDRRVVKGLFPALRDSCGSNPRTLKRRINAIIVDARLAPEGLLNLVDPDPTKARAWMMGLCLLEQTARQSEHPDLLKRLGEESELCKKIGDHGLRELWKSHRGNLRMMGIPDSSGASARPRDPSLQTRVGELIGHTELLDQLNSVASLDGLLKLEFGKRWLSETSLRDRLLEFLGTRPSQGLDEPSDEPVATPPQAAPSADRHSTTAPPDAPSMRGSADSVTKTQATLGVERPATRSSDRLGPPAEAERAIVERAIRESLLLDRDVELTAERFGEVTTIDLESESVGDTTISWLAAANTGLNALQHLNLGGTGIGDYSLKALVNQGTGLSTLRSLNLQRTSVTDEGVKALATEGTGLTALTSLNLRNTAVTDEGARALASEHSRLKLLKSLDLSKTAVTDDGVKALTRTDTPLGALLSLSLADTKVTDDGIKALARRDSGLKRLRALDLGGSTGVKDESVRALASRDTSLSELEYLNLRFTRVTDRGLAALADDRAGTTALRALDLTGLDVTDAGVQALVRNGRGPIALESLSLQFTRVTDAGLAALSHKDNGLKALKSLDLSNTKVTDAGAGALANTNSSLKYVTHLYLDSTSVSDEGVEAIARKGTALRALEVLGLSRTQVTNRTLIILARADTPLTQLKALNLAGIKVTDSGLVEVARAGAGFEALSSLDLSKTLVTDTGVIAFAEAPNGPTSLSKLYLSFTRVTDAAVNLIKARWPGIEVFR